MNCIAGLVILGIILTEAFSTNFESIMKAKTKLYLIKLRYQVSEVLIMSNNSNWGGYRQGSGQKPKWNLGETKPIRLPVKLHQEIMGIARLLDSGEYTTEELLSCEIKPQLETVTESNDENVTLSNKLETLINNWQEKAKNATSPRWSHAKKLLIELKELLKK